MKVLLFNGSSNEHGCTYTALKEIADVLENNGMILKLFKLEKVLFVIALVVGLVEKLVGNACLKMIL